MPVRHSLSVSSPWFNQVTQGAGAALKELGGYTAEEAKTISLRPAVKSSQTAPGSTVTDGRGRRPGHLELGTDPQTQAPHQSH